MTKLTLCAFVLCGWLTGCNLVDWDGDGVRTLACLGDSNTAHALDGMPTSWCDRLSAALPKDVVVFNFAWGGSTATGVTWVPDLAMQLTWALAAHADVIVTAFGSNDIIHGVPPDRIIAAEAAARQAAAAVGRPLLIGTIPPDYGVPGMVAAGDAVNTALRATVPPWGLLDLDSGVGPEQLGPDGLHLNEAGQAQRLLCVLRQL